METFMKVWSYSEPLIRWLHIVAGILWIGMLYFFNFVNGFVAAKLDGDAKKKVVPELMPRALFWFRWGAAWTWISGFILLAVIYYHQKNLFENAMDPVWKPLTITLGLAVLVVPMIYDLLAKSVAKNEVMAVIGLVFVTAYAYLASSFGGFGYRGYVIHIGAIFGTIMAMNVWMRIWPSQRQIITAVKNGTAPDAKLVALAGTRSRHNTYMSVPLIWSMINAHTTAYASCWLYVVGAVAVGWFVVMQFYKKAAKVTGF